MEYNKLEIINGIQERVLNLEKQMKFSEELIDRVTTEFQ
jgi:hypothetical protein